MKNKKTGLLILAIALFVCFLPKFKAQASQQNVLLFHSYHQEYDWTGDIQKGFEDSLYEEFPDARFFVEYMDTKRIYTEEYLEVLRKAYELKYGNKKFDVILSSDDNALNFLLENREQLFPDAPIVFCGVNYFEPEKVKDHKNITGVNEEASFRESLDLALKLHPYVSKIVIVNDTTTTGKIVDKEIQENLAELKKKYSVEILGDSAIDKVIERVGEYNAKDTLIYFTLYLRDGVGQSFEVGDVVSMLKRSSDIPIYGTWGFSLGHGIVGGYLTSGHHQGERAGKIATRILNGEKADDIPVLMETPKEYMFDWNELEANDINLDLLPNDSTIINKPISFYEENKAAIHSVILLITFLILIITVLVLFILKRKQRGRFLREYNLKLKKEIKERTQSLQGNNKESKKEGEAKK